MLPAAAPNGIDHQRLETLFVALYAANPPAIVPKEAAEQDL